MDPVLHFILIASLQPSTSSTMHCNHGTYAPNRQVKVCKRIDHLMDLKFEMLHISWWLSFARRQAKIKGARRKIEQNTMVFEQQVALHQNWKVGLPENPALSQLELVVTVAVVGMDTRAIVKRRTSNVCWRQELHKEEHAELDNSV